jgi:hypothetical protein
VASVQSVVIFLLLVAVAEDYNHNQYFQAWAGANLGGLGILLNGTLATFYAGMLVAVFPRRPPDPTGNRVRKREPVVVSPETPGPSSRTHDFIKGGARENRPPRGVT